MVCGARRKADGQPCQRRAMANGRCYVHGGASTGRPIEHGLKAKRLHQSLHKRAQELKTLDEQPLSLLDELGLLRALLENQLNQIGDDIDERQRANVLTLIDAIGKTAMRVHRIISRTALTVAEVEAIKAALTLAFEEVSDVAERERALRRFMAALHD